MKIKSQKDFFSGLMFGLIGLAFALGARGYNLGSGARMGPGYFPMLLGILLALLGALVMFNAMVIETEGGEKVGKWAWKPIGYVLGANVVFGILLSGLPSIKLPAAGLIAGIYALTIIASLAEDHFRWRSVLILATVLAIGSYLAFIVLLKLQFQVWPAFITG